MPTIDSSDIWIRHRGKEYRMSDMLDRLTGFQGRDDNPSAVECVIDALSQSYNRLEERVERLESEPGYRLVEVPALGRADK